MGVIILDCCEERIYNEAHYIIEKGATVREASRAFHTGKSTVHKDVTVRLNALNGTLASEVRKVLDKNKAERHIRGGQATLRKYRGRAT